VKGLTFLRWSRQVGPGEKRVYTGAVFGGLVWSLGLTLAGFLALGIWAVASNSTILHFSTLITVITIAAAIFGGIMSGIASRIQGWLHGALVGILYGLLFLIFAVIMASETLGMALLARTLLFIPCGALGGTLGVNIPSMKFKLPRKAGSQ